VSEDAPVLVRLEELSRSFGDLVAVDRLSLATPSPFSTNRP